MARTNRRHPSDTRHGERPQFERTERDEREQIDRWLDDADLDGDEAFLGFDAFVRAPEGTDER